MQNKLCVCACVLIAAAVFCISPADAAREKYEANWDSLREHPIPEWLVDAKFGIYAHWGVYSVPAYGHEWYAKRMYNPENPKNIYQHHIENYGHPTEFGYKDFIPMFRAKKFDPGEWADVIAGSGAKYAGICVIHHDGFAMWDSDVSSWNVGDRGPTRDLYGDLVQALRAEGLKTVATFHHRRTFNWYLPRKKKHRREILESGEYDLTDPRYRYLYWNESTSTKEEFLKQWEAKVREVLDTYRPDVIWFDGGDFKSGGPGDAREALAHYLNSAREWGKRVEVLNKLPVSKEFNFPDDFGILTFEQGRDRPVQVERPWVDDLKIGYTSWGYIEGMEYKPVNLIVDGLVGRVARNGGLLLSLSPKADGTLPEGQKDVLRGMGEWLDVNGEAIYSTRPWKIQGEGPLEEIRKTGGRHVKWDFKKADADHIRFTKKGNTLYAIALGWPKGGTLTVQKLGKSTRISRGGIHSVSLLGSDAELEWERTEKALTVQLPDERPCEHAYAFKISVEGSLAE